MNWHHTISRHDLPPSLPNPWEGSGVAGTWPGATLQWITSLTLATCLWNVGGYAMAEIEPDLQTPPPPTTQTVPAAPLAAPATALAPVDVKPIVDRGNEKFAQGNWRGAIADYSMALQLNSASVDALVRRGVARFRIGDRQGSRADFQRANQLNPDAVPAFLNELLNQAVTAKNWPESIRVIDQMIVVFPGQAKELRAYRARLLAISGL